MIESETPCLTLLRLPPRHAAGRHLRRRRDEEGGATREDGGQPGRGRQVGRGESGRIHYVFFNVREGFVVSEASRVFPSQEGRPRHFLIGCIGVSGKTKWDVLDGVVRRLFKVNTTRCSPATDFRRRGYLSV